MPITKEKRYTAEEFFKMTPESSSERYELINGDILALAAPNTIHQRIVKKIIKEIDGHINRKNGKCESFMSPYDVKLDDYNVVQPDILVVCDKDKIDDKRCNGAPDFVIEVTSSNNRHDYVDKFVLYRNSEVREYWIVDTNSNRILVYNWDKDESPNIYTFEQDAPVGIFNDELKINIAGLI